jgi:predicted RNA-binding protein YlxR (DUF448 family)
MPLYRRKQEMSKKGHHPIRMCIGCLKKKNKGEMIRFIQSSDRLVIVDEKKNLSGRGYYLCPDAACLKKARKKRWAFTLESLDQRYFSSGIFSLDDIPMIEEEKAWQRSKSSILRVMSESRMIGCF